MPEQRWRELCWKAAMEQDPEKLAELVREINRLLKKRQESLAAERGAVAVPKRDLR